MSTAANKALVRQAYEEVFNQGHLEAAEQFFSEDFVNYAGPPNWPRGPESIRQTVTMLRTAFPDLHYTVEEVIAEGDTIAARWLARGTHQGELRGPLGSIAPTGREVSFRGITMGTVIEGKAGGSWVVWDQLGLMQQLGLLASIR